MAVPRLEVNDMQIAEILEDYASGRLVVPEFQREYVWKKSKAPKLLDSLYRQYPISSILLWESGDGRVEPRSRSPRPASGASVKWLIDGQQRVLTLHRIKNGEIEVVFNPDGEGQFSLRNAANNNNRNWIAVDSIWDGDSYRRIIGDYPGAAADAIERVRRILEYKMPFVNMRDHAFRDAVEAFKRINTQGVRLRSEDIQSAEIAAKHSGFVAERVMPFVKTLHKRGFDRLTIMHLFRVCAFLAIPDERSRTPLHAIERKVMEKAWDRAEAATDSAIGELKESLGLVNMETLWTGALLVPLIVLIALRDEGADIDVEEAIGWLVLAAIKHRYTGASDTALTQDLKACRRDDPIGALLHNLREAEKYRDLEVSAADFRGGIGDRGELFATYVACYQRGMKSFSGGNVGHQECIHRHHILPRRQFEAADRAKSDVVANIAFVLGPDNQSVGAEPPEKYLAKVKREVLESQCIPLDQSLWTITNANQFWAERQELLAKSFNEFLRGKLPNRRKVISGGS